MAPGTWDITVLQGATWTRPLAVADSGVARDLAGYVIRMHVRKHKSSTDTILELSIGSGITVTDAAAGEFQIQLSATATAALPVVSGYKYDLELESAGGVVTRLLEGSFSVSGEVTR